MNDQQDSAGGPAPFELRDDLELSKSILLGEKAIQLTMLLVLPWIVLLVGMGEWVCTVLVSLLLIPSGLALWLYRRGRTLLARVMWLLTCASIVAVIALYYSGPTAHEVIFLVLLGFPVLILSWSKERRPMLLTLSYVAVLALIAFLDSTHQLGAALGLPQKAPDANAPLIQLGIYLSAGLIVVAQLTYLAINLEQSTEEARDALREAKAAYTARSQFLANMSHEIRTPMNGIIGTLDILEHSGIRPNQRRSMATIRESAVSLLRVIDDVLDASKIEAGKLDIIPAKAELADIIEQVALTLVPLASSHGVRLRLFIDPQLPDWVEVDAVRLRQILLNIFSNAVKYSASSLTDRPGEVVLYARRAPGSMLSVELQDNGIGMDEELVQTFCDPYVQGHETLFSSIRGTGLGMAITKRLIDLMGGTMEVESVAGEGTKLTIELPLVPVAGPPLRPDLNGLHIICVGPPTPGLVKGLDVILVRAGITVDMTDDLDASVPLDLENPAEVTFLLLPSPPAQVKIWEDHIKTHYPGAGIMRATADRSVLFSRPDDRTVVFPVYPMQHNDFYAAIAELAGRSIPRPPWQKEAAQKRPANPKSSIAGQRVLLVDDNAINLHVLRSQLELLGHHAVTASNGRDALQQWEAGNFDMIITDCQMPEMSGFAMSRAIRLREKERGTGPVPILAVTANIDKENEKNFATSGMDAWLLKPVTFDTLRNAIESALAGELSEVTQQSNKAS